MYNINGFFFYSFKASIALCCVLLQWHFGILVKSQWEVFPSNEKDSLSAF